MTESLSPAEPLQDTRSQYSGTVVGIQKRISPYTGLHERRIVLDDIKGPSSELLRDRQAFSFGTRFMAL